MTDDRRFSARLIRFGALLAKEWAQMRRDPSILLVAWVLPAVLIVLFGAGLSMDLSSVRAALTDSDRSALSRELAARFLGSPYFDAEVFASRQAAEKALASHEVDLIVELPETLSRDAQLGRGVIGVTIYGVDASAAMMMRTYAVAALTQGAQAADEAISAPFVRSADAAAKPLDEIARLAADLPPPAAPSEGRRPRTTNAAPVGADFLEAAADAPAASAIASLPGPIQPIVRSWFNEANNSAWYLVPGLTIVILTLTCSFMGSLLIAREWERGTMETLATTPVCAVELVAAKFLLYFALSCGGLAAVFSIAAVGFDVPVRGSAWLLLATCLVYNAWAMAFGLVLSALTRSQFVAIQLAVILTYLPALILSGFLFDLRSVPSWIAAVARLMPSTYAVESVKILCLSGGAEGIVLKNLAVLCAAFAGFLAAGVALTRKRLD